MFNTVFLTVLSGVLVYVIGQIFSKFFIESIYKQKEVIGKISDALIFYANLYTSPKPGKVFDRPEGREEASDLFKRLACELSVKTDAIPCYNFLSFIKIVRKKKYITEAHCDLTGLSNSMYPTNSTQVSQNDTRCKNLEKSLKLMIGN